MVLYGHGVSFSSFMTTGVKVLKTYMYLVLRNDSQAPKKINTSVEFNRNTHQIKASEIIGLLAAKTGNRQCRLCSIP